MDVIAIDERMARWAIDFPDYVVQFFEPRGRRMPEGGTYLATTSTYRVSGAHNVHQVLAWADAYAKGRRYIACVEVEQERIGLGLLQLCGDDPNRPNDPHRTSSGDLGPGPVERDD